MWSYAALGWRTARKEWFLLFLLFIYQYVFGYVLFNYVKSKIVPLLHRYPGSDLTEFSSQLFWLEAQFRLTKTDLIMPYLWTFAIFLAFRMLLTPLINSGIYNALSNAKEEGGSRKAFFRGIRQYAKPFLLLYGLQMALTFAPLAWIVPRLVEAGMSTHSWTALAMEVLPYLLGWFAYQGLLDLIFMYIGFGIVSGQGGWTALAVVGRRSLQASALGLTVFLISCAVGLATAAASLWWAGFIAVLIHLSYPLVRILLHLWAISAQHHLWNASKP